MAREGQLEKKLIYLDQYINPAYKPFFQSRKRYCVLYGGRSAGKSQAVAQKLVLTTTFFKNKKFLVCRKTFPSLKHTCWEFIQEWFDKFHLKYELNKADMIIYGPNGNRFLFKALDDSRKFKSLTDVDFLWIDEVDEITRDEFLDVAITVRGEELTPPEYRQIIVTFNPGYYSRWLHDLFFDPKSPYKKDTDIFHFTYKDNKFLSDEDREQLEALKKIDYYKYQVYCLGEWGVLRNKIYENYVVEEFDYPMDWYDDIFAGVDFGYNNPSAFVIVGLKDQELYIIDEVYKKKILNSEFISLIKEKLNEYQLYDIPIYADSAEQDRIREFIEADLLVYPAKKDVLAGIREVQKYKLHIHERCSNLVKEIREYKWKEDSRGEPLEQPVKENDHACDALRYAVYSRLGKVSVSPKISVL